MSNQLILQDVGDYLPTPKSIDEAMKIAGILIESGFAPPSYKKPAQVLAAIQYGKELGLKPMHALHSISVINGKPAAYGDGLLAICMSSPDFEDIKESEFKEIKANGKAICTSKRKGRSPVTREFSIEDAKKAGLWGKPGPWTTYPERMLQMRARSWSLRDAFADRLQGLIAEEEAQDIPVNRPSVVNFAPTKSSPSYSKGTEKIIEAVVERHEPVIFYDEEKQAEQQDGNNIQEAQETNDIEVKLKEMEQCTDFASFSKLSNELYKETKKLPPEECVNARQRIKQKYDELKKLFGDNKEAVNANGTVVQNS